MKEERLYIVGYMASGKSTFGQALAEAAGWNFLDLDREIERREGRTISDIIAAEGEEYFRQLESKILKETASLKRTVVACGGGTPCFRDNMEFMTLHGRSLWLIASPQRIAERIEEAGESRPLVAGKDRKQLLDFIHTHLRRRQAHYCKAMWRFSGEHLENSREIKDTVDEFLRRYPLD